MYVKPREASKYFNVSDNTLRCWARDGKIQYFTTEGGHRRYLLPTERSNQSQNETMRQKIIYARVSSSKQREDLVRQVDFLKIKYPNHVVITDIGSGINFERVGFKRILEKLFSGNVEEVVVAHRDRFTRFGFSLFEWIFKRHNATLLCDTEASTSDGGELSEDIMAIITVFSARYHGRRKYASRQRAIL